MGAQSKELKRIFAESVLTAVSKAYSDSGIDTQAVINSISKPRKDYGDMSSSIAFRIAKSKGVKPMDAAVAIAKGFDVAAPFTEVKVMGGYVNAYVDEKAYAHMVIADIEKEGDRYASSGMGKGEKVMVEYPAVNPNKPWHIGHLRNALLGDSISNLLDFAGYKVEREDYIDDLGLQIAESFWGYRNLGNAPEGKFDEWLGKQYVEVNKRMKEGNLGGEISGLLKLMEEGDSEEARQARQISERCVDAQYDTAYAYGIYHDVMIWESDIVKARLLQKALDMAMARGALERRTAGKNAGCVVMDLGKVRDFAKDFENPEETEKVIVRSDGTATYVAKDIAFHMWKLGLIKDEFSYKGLGDHGGRMLYSTSASGGRESFGNASIAVNVIGSAQRYPQLIVKAVFRLMGYGTESERIVHVAYGEVSIEGGTLSGRKGGWMGDGDKAFTADALLREAVQKALDATAASKRISDSKMMEQVARAVGKSAIRFEFLRTSPGKPVVFSWKSALNFEGNSGPYCMYTFARAMRILEKAGYSREGIGAIDFKAVERGYDFELVKLLGEAQEVVEKAASEYSPNVVTDYLMELTSAFSKFYETMPVISSGAAKGFRMRLLDAYMQVAKNMFGLVGIDALASM